MGKRQIWNTCCIFGVVMALALVLADTAFAEYTHGYFKYDVADGSVTITGYVGSDEVVTVPNMIAGNPVNVIGEGAFASSFDIKKVRIPTSVIKVERGALAPGQALEYIDSHGNPLGNADAGDAQNGDDVQGEEVEGEAQEENTDVAAAAPNAAIVPVGIRLKDGSFVTVDFDGNLVVADAKGNERVLDDTQAYVCETTTEGDVVIRDSTGKVVEVDAQAATVSYVDKDSQQMKYDSLQRTTQITYEDGETLTIEHDTEENTVVAEGKSKQQVEGEQNKQPQKTQQTSTVSIIVVLVVALGVGVCLMWRFVHRTKEDAELPKER